MAENLFRKVSLERISSPEQLDKLLVIVKIKGWLALLCLVGITVAIVAWSVVGTLPIATEGRGILLDPRGLQGVYSQTEGQVVQILARTGGEIKKGETLLVMQNPIFAIKLREQMHRIEALKSLIAKLEKDFEIEKKIKDEELTKKLELEELILKTQKAKLAIMEKELEQAAPSRKPNLENEILEQKALMESQLLSISIFHSEKLLDATVKHLDVFHSELHKLVGEYDLLKMQKESLVIKAPHDGRVIEIDVELGRQIEPGAPLMWIQSGGEKGKILPFYCFVPVNMGEKIKPGMGAQISFLAVDTQLYGQLLGRVERVLPYAASRNAQQLAGIPSKVLKGYLGAGLTSILVVIDPILDPKTPTGYKWTTKLGPPEWLNPGAIGTARIILEEKKPISYALPVFKGKRTQSGS